MSNALMGIANRLANEDGNPAAQNPVQAKLPVIKSEQSSIEKLKAAMDDLRALQENSSHIHKVEPENLRTLCKLQLVDVSVSEKGKQTIQSFQAVESLAGELQGSAPAMESITQYRKEHKAAPQ